MPVSTSKRTLDTAAEAALPPKQDQTKKILAHFHGRIARDKMALSMFKFPRLPLAFENATS